MEDKILVTMVGANFEYKATVPYIIAAQAMTDMEKYLEQEKLLEEVRKATP